MSERENDSSNRIARLEKADDYILWKRRVYAYIRRYDAELVGFETEPSSNSPSIRKKWFEFVIRAKSIIVLSLGDSPLAKVRHLVDDDAVSAKQLWDELGKIYTASNAQAILNLRQDMDNLRYKEGASWDDHVNKFTELLNKLATYDEELSEKEKASKLLRSIPESFSGFAMIAQVQDLQFERLIQAMHAEISRRQSVQSSSLNTNITASIADLGFTRNGRTSHEGRIAKTKRKSNGACYVCGKLGHYAAECWHRANSSGQRGRGRGGFRGERGRSRGRGHGRGQGYYRHSYDPQLVSHESSRQGSFSPGSGSGSTWNRSSGNEGFRNQNQAQANIQQYGLPSHPRNDRERNNSFQGLMARVKFRSSIASVSTKKVYEALIDSGATHNFFHSKEFFHTYQEIHEEVRSASGTSRIVGAGQVFLPLDGGI